MIHRQQLSRSRFVLASMALLALLCSACSKEGDAPAPASAPEAASAENPPLVVYAEMPASRLQSVLDAYTAETGRKVQLIAEDRDVSTSPISDPGSLPAADLVLARSLTELWRFAEMDGFRPTFSESIEINILPALRDPESRWTALAIHGRMIVYNTELVDGDALSDLDSYAALGKERWRGKLCLSSAAVPGNRTLVAFLIRQYDLREAEITVRNWRANFAAGVFNDDSSLIQAISDGQCAIGIAGSNVLAAYVATNAGAPIAPHLFADPGSMIVDASGGGVTRHAHNPGHAVALLEWLTTSAPNALYAALGQEFPANAGAPASLSIKSWRDSVSEPNPFSQLGFLQEDAVLLMERARYP